ncbi:O-antigen ligase family protein [Sphingomonas sp. 37zxx]|uniref:O-antigen ligase family protein n=1 Tax=Sphingomonas sp. 37zxx TaxID=1550073 RepID=UPI00053BDB2B|nr:O-antigen ligase family protein [Sphingomonas sp. 37zxx]
MTQNRLRLIATFFCAALLFGGASAAGLVANAAVQIAAIALALSVLATRKPPPRGTFARNRWPLLLFALTAAMMLLHIVPLPPSIWQALPQRSAILDGFVLAGVEPGWLPLSLTPDSAIGALVSLVPPFAMFVAVIDADDSDRIWLLRLLVAMAALSSVVGGLQRIQGIDSPLYPYAITNRGSAVGFFANRNHLGTLLLCSVPCWAVLARRALAAPVADRRWQPLYLAGLAIAAPLILGGLTIIGSVAVAVMAGPVIALSVAIILAGRNKRFGRATWLGIGAIVAVTVAALSLGLSSPEPSSSQQRDSTIPTTLRAATAYLPLGSGAGSFTTVYPRYEYPAAVTPEYVNHAHSDFAEWLLEYGLPGLAVIAAALAWWGRAAWRAWAPGGGDIARAAMVALGVILVHSMVDYPLRTAAIAVVAALAAALATSPSGSQADSRSGQQRRSSRLLTGANAE